MRIAVVGVDGRMGREVIAALTAQGDELVAAFGRQGAERNGDGANSARMPLTASAIPCLATAGALIDFSAPAACTEAVALASAAGVPFVSGTTGLDPAQMDMLRQAATTIPVFYARNMSIGVASLLAALPTLVAALPGFDIEIVETHHRHKVDAPSGTALTLAETIANTRSAAGGGSSRTIFGREGIAPRQSDEIGIHAVRGGGNPGEHQIIFAADGEEVRLSHRSFSRRAYAEGAVRAAHFLQDRPPGWYTLSDLMVAPA